MPVSGVFSLARWRLAEAFVMHVNMRDVGARQSDDVLSAC